ncbi:MAG: biopolymer transporter ExbD [Moraxellaceae bacterium]
MSATQRRQIRQRQKKQQVAQLSLTSLMDIFTILVFFLLVNAQNPVQMPSLKDLTLPRSSTSDGIEHSLTVVIAQNEIRVNDKTVMNFDPTSETPDLQALAQVLMQERGKQKPTQVVNGIAQYQVVIMADQKTPYAFLKQVMRTCGEQQFGQISFAVLREAKNV